MAKSKSKKIKLNLTNLIVLGAAALALIFAAFLPVAKYDDIIGGTTTFGYFPAAFGITTNYVNGSASLDTATGAISIFGLISFILAVLGILAVAGDLFFPKKNLLSVGSLALVVAGIFTFLVLVAGTEGTEGLLKGMAFADLFTDFELGAGAYVTGILFILGGGYGLAKTYLLK